MKWYFQSKLYIALATNILRGSVNFKVNFVMPNMTLSGNLYLFFDYSVLVMVNINSICMEDTYSLQHHLLLVFVTVWRPLCFEGVYF